MIKQIDASLAGHFVVTLPIALTQNDGAISKPRNFGHEVFQPSGRSSHGTNPQAQPP